MSPWYSVARTTVIAFTLLITTVNSGITYQRSTKDLSAGAAYVEDVGTFNLTVASLEAQLPNTQQVHLLNKRAAKDFYLRVMPLGASITNGINAGDHNGYRKHIRDQLRYQGWKVNMVGTIQTGTMLDNDNEGHSGWKVADVYNAAVIAAPKYMPNLILINVGSNDIWDPNTNLAQTGDRMKRMIDYLFATIPGTTIILSTLVPNLSGSEWYGKINDQYRRLVLSYNNPRLVLADMMDFLTNGDISADGTHPNDFGYKKMASVWSAAINSVEDLLMPPDPLIDDSKQITNNKCDKALGMNGLRGPIKTQGGSGWDNGVFVHAQTCDASVWSQPALDPPNLTLPSEMYFAQLVGVPGNDRSLALDELIHVYTYNGAYVWHFARNTGVEATEDTQFKAWVDFNPGNCAINGAIAFGDMNDDGLDDVFCIGPGGETSASLNLGGDPPQFSGFKSIIGAQGGYVAKDVRIADIDGDGRVDYCLLNNNGDIRCWRNGGQGQYPEYWQSFGAGGAGGDVVFTGISGKDKAGVILGDLNGDFRADWMWLSDSGSIDTYINYPGWGLGIVPYWMDAARTHAGGSATARSQIKLGRVYGTGKLDYVYFYLSDDKKTWHMRVCKETGGGGTLHKGAGAFYCDMTGTGDDDYVWISSTGRGELYPNIQNTNPVWHWGQWLSVEDFDFNIDRPRQGIHLADTNGDGRCDIVFQRKSDGALEVWRNDYNPITRKWKFTPFGFYSAPRCSAGWGVGLNDRGLHLADLNGDGRADYICIERSGRITAWLNLPVTGWTNVGEIKSSEGWDRANLRIADVNGDGRADILWVDKWNGQTTVWLNVPAGGNAINWVNPNRKNILYPSIGERGANIKFPKIGGHGRADLHQIYPLSNKAYTYFNECPNTGGAGGDDGSIGNPNLPTYTRPAVAPWYWFGGTGPDYLGGLKIRHSDTWVPGANGEIVGERDWCHNYQALEGFYFPKVTPVVHESPTDMSWMSIPCTIPEVVNTGFTYNAQARWVATGAQSALRQAWACWYLGPFNDYPDIQRNGWSPVVFNYFHGQDSQRCDRLQGGYCETIQTCSEAGHAAGFLVLNSFVQLHKVVAESHKAMSDTWVQSMISQGDLLIKTFSPQVKPDTLQWLKILLDVVGLGFSLAAAPIWNVALKTSPRWAGAANQNNLGWLKDSVNGVVSGGISTIKDILPPPDSVKDPSDRIKLLAQGLLDSWKAAHEASLITLFSPDDAQFGTFLDLVDNGAVLDIDVSADIKHIEQMAKYALWGTLIPYAWSLSNENHHPFIMVPEQGDRNECIRDQPTENAKKWIEESALDMVTSCVDNWTLHLVSAPDGGLTCHHNGEFCDIDKFRALPGMKQILANGPDDGNIWGGITRDEIVRGSWESFQHDGGNVSPYTRPLTNLEDADTYEMRMRSGFWRIPICTAEEAKSNIIKGGMKDNYAYPCNPR